MYTITGTAANVHDIEETAKLIREDDDAVYGDSGYNGAEKWEEILRDGHLSNAEFRTNRRPSSIKVSSFYKGINWGNRNSFEQYLLGNTKSAPPSIKKSKGNFMELYEEAGEMFINLNFQIKLMNLQLKGGSEESIGK